MKAKVLKINVHHPRTDIAFAELVASGKKSVELRSWPTDFRGPLLIEYRGEIIALVRLVDCRKAVKADLLAACVKEFPAAIRKFNKAWVFEEMRRLKTPVASSGSSQLYDLEITKEIIPEYFEMAQ